MVGVRSVPCQGSPQDTLLVFPLVSDLLPALCVYVWLTRWEDLYSCNLGPAPLLLKQARWSISICRTNEGFSQKSCGFHQ